MTQKTMRRLKFARRLLYAQGFALVLAAGCADERQENIKHEIEQYEKSHRAVESAAPPSATPPKSGFPVSDKVSLDLGMTREDAEARLPRTPDDPPDSAAGMYAVSI